MTRRFWQGVTDISRRRLCGVPRRPRGYERVTIEQAYVTSIIHDVQE
jgi:hypothetical protein